MKEENKENLWETTPTSSGKSLSVSRCRRADVFAREETFLCHQQTSDATESSREHFTCSFFWGFLERRLCHLVLVNSLYFFVQVRETKQEVHESQEESTRANHTKIPDISRGWNRERKGRGQGSSPKKGGSNKSPHETAKGTSKGSSTTKGPSKKTSEKSPYKDHEPSTSASANTTKTTPLKDLATAQQQGKNDSPPKPPECRSPKKTRKEKQK